MQLKNQQMLPLEDQLRELVLEARQYPAGHLKRRQCLTQMVRLIENSHKLWHEHTPYYEDALQQTWVYFCQNICEPGTGEQYNPDRSSVITWLNRYLKWRLQDFRIGQQKQLARCTSVAPGAVNKNQDITNAIAAPPDTPPILENTRQWVETDPEGDLANAHIQNRPDVTCQVLLLRRLPPEQSWEKISGELGLPISTLSSFYQRQCIPRLRNFGQAQGYL
ncbi:sigma-70 family RNA polymerase sigma factor [Acaryochloris sp. IP29b_bin.137]|uniref:sigma-70 family RNA polymerase sigma factor n=1 Tax=Acaryochloris sp. IP29b_bin.137 TaxID=2969217 RepID=UPI0026167E43|nr:sigma-70 family RNA polymerase sigma factor [Acaryochloris sp. IP29b_bin.137]